MCMCSVSVHAPTTTPKRRDFRKCVCVDACGRGGGGALEIDLHERLFLALLAPAGRPARLSGRRLARRVSCEASRVLFSSVLFSSRRTINECVQQELVSAGNEEARSGAGGQRTGCVEARVFARHAPRRDARLRARRRRERAARRRRRVRVRHVLHKADGRRLHLCARTNNHRVVTIAHEYIRTLQCNAIDPNSGCDRVRRREVSVRMIIVQPSASLGCGGMLRRSKWMSSPTTAYRRRSTSSGSPSNSSHSSGSAAQRSASAHTQSRVVHYCTVQYYTVERRG